MMHTPGEDSTHYSFGTLLSRPEAVWLHVRKLFGLPHVWVAKDAKKLEKLFEYESKKGAVIWVEDLMLLDAYDLNHASNRGIDAETCMSLRPSVDSHRNTRGSERPKDA